MHRYFRAYAESVGGETGVCLYEVSGELVTRQIWQFGDELFWAQLGASKSEEHEFTDQPEWNAGDGAIDLAEVDALQFHVLWFQSDAPGHVNSRLDVRFHDQTFTLGLDECEDGWLTGSIRLDDSKRSALRRTLADETEWCLDENGERLESTDLFGQSPWAAVNSQSADTKLLCRFLDIETGQIKLNTPEGYVGELFDWVRKRS